MSGKNLIEIASQASSIVERIIENGGEIPPDLEEQFLDVEKSLATKVDNYIGLWERMDFEAEYFKRKSDEMLAISRSAKAVRDNLKERMKYAMQVMGVEEVEGESHRLKLAKTSGKLVIHDDSLLPDEFKTEVISIEVDKKALKEAIQNGEEIHGAEIEVGDSLRKYINRKV